MHRYRSCPATWFLALLVLTPLGGWRVAGQGVPPAILHSLDPHRDR